MVAVAAIGHAAAADEGREHVGVLAEVAVLADALRLRVGRDDQPVGAVVVVPARDRRDRDDRLEALDAGGRDLVRKRAVVGDAGHADGAGRPVRLNPVAGRVEAARAAVQPVDHGLRAERLDTVADGRAAVRVEGADALAEHHGVAARHVVVVERAAGQVRASLETRAGARPGGCRLRALRAGGARAARGSGAVVEEVLLREHVEVDGVVGGVAEVAPIRAVLEDHRNVVAERLGLGRAADLDPHAVAVAIPVAVELRLDEDDLLDRLGEVELRLGLPVLDLEPRRWRRVGGGRRPRCSCEQAQQRDGQHAALAKSR